MLSKIISSLQTHRDKTFGELNGTYTKNSKWLNDELDIVRNLICTNSGKSKTTSKFGAGAKGSKSTSSRAVTSTSKSCVSNQGAESDRRIKRKTPEQSMSGTKISPAQKRNSAEYEKASIQAGLPSDLNRLKKDQLLKELSKRGNDALSMKSLKKDMVDALKKVLLEESDKMRQEEQEDTLEEESGEEQEEVQEKEEEEAVSTVFTAVESAHEHAAEEVKEYTDKESLAPDQLSSPITTSGTKSMSGSARKKSLMAEYRKELSSQQAAEHVESESERDLRLQTEFQRRHSNAMNRKSQGHIEDVHGNSNDTGGRVEASVEDNVNTVDYVNTAGEVAVVSEERKSNADQESQGGDTGGTPRDSMMSTDGSTWMEVASPQPTGNHNIAGTNNIGAELDAATSPQQGGAVPKDGRPSLIISPIKVSETPVGKSNDHNNIPISAQKTASDQMMEATGALNQLESKDSSYQSVSKPPKQSTTGYTTAAEAFTQSASKAPQSVQKKGLFSFLSKSQDANTSIFSSAAKPAVNPNPASTVKAPQENTSTNAASAIMSEGTNTSSLSTLKPNNENTAPTTNHKDEYKIEDAESDGSASGTDDEGENKSKHSKVPEWARGTNLKEALERQYGLRGKAPMDPDTIFPEVRTCSLEEIFGSSYGKSGAYNKRSSSAHWDADELTMHEKRSYRNQMGFS